MYGECPLQSPTFRDETDVVHVYPVGPAVEAFGFQRILFGSSAAAPLTGNSPASNAGDWYEIARESFAELGVEQDAIDAVFAENAKLVYGASP